MKILIVDDEKFQHIEIQEVLEEIMPGNEYYFALRAGEAMKVIEEEKIDIAFLDVEMPGKTGLELAQEIKQASPSTNIIIVTAYSQYALDALKLYVSGYIMKPVLIDDMREALSNLRSPVDADAKDSKPDAVFYAGCFGNFDLFDKDGNPVYFRRQKSKELVAYLICLKGTTATSGEICAAIFEEDGDPDKQASYLRRIAADARKDLYAAGAQTDVILRKKNTFSIDTRLIDCDYWQYLDDPDAANNAYRGEFMNQYSWAERYIYNLENYD